MLTDLKKPMFTFQDLSFVTGLPVATIKAWHTRGILVMSDNDRPATRRGNVALLSGITSFQVVIMAELTRLGVPVPVAAKAGKQFLSEDFINVDNAFMFVGINKTNENIQSCVIYLKIEVIKTPFDFFNAIASFNGAVATLCLSEIIKKYINKMMSIYSIKLGLPEVATRPRRLRRAARSSA